MDEPSDVGFLGLGQMGAPMAERLLGGPFTLHVCDPQPLATAPFEAAGAVVHATPRSVADAASVVFACLPSQAVSEAVATGPDGVADGAALNVYVEMSTIGRTLVETIATRLAEHGVATVDGPVTGGPPAAREGRLTMLVSGEAQAVARARPLLERIGRAVHVLGERPGQAQTMKLVNNLILAANMVTASEGLAMGMRAGIDLATLVEVIAVGTGRSVALNDVLARAIVEETFDFGAHLSIVAKDAALAMDEADALGLDLPAATAARDVWTAAGDAGLSSEDITRIFTFVRERAGGLGPKKP